MSKLAALQEMVASESTFPAVAAFGVLLFATSLYLAHSRGGISEGFVEKASQSTPQLVGIQYERYYAVITAYRRVLERPPTEDELQRMTMRIGSDPEFDVASLEQELRHSPEYRRLTGMQKNTMYSELDDVVSEKALKTKLTDMYKRVTGQEIDDVTMDFLFARYRHSSLNDAYITALM